MKNATRRFCTLAASAAAVPAFAHDAHGRAATHWHATDAAGLLLVGVLAVLALWLARGER